MSGRISLRPSDAETWLECTMSPVFIADNHHRIPEDKGSVWSDEGTVAHDAAEKLLRGEDVDLPDNGMRAILDGYVEYVLDKWSPGDKLLVEQNVPLWYMPARKGKVDAIVWRLNRTTVEGKQHNNLYITDLKYGEGVAVYARENKQLAIYGRSVIEHLKKQGHTLPDDLLVTMSIYQPRCSRGELISIWALRVHELLEFTSHIESIAADIQARRNLQWHVSKTTCRWCKAAAICPERTRKLLGAAGPGLVERIAPELVSDEIRMIPAAEHLDLETLVRVYEHADDFRAWLKDVESHLFNFLASGKTDPKVKYKLVDKKDGAREWVDPDLASSFLADYLPEDVYAPRSIVTAPQAEKLVPKKHQDDNFKMMFDMLVRKKPSTGRTMVPLDDERESVVLDVNTEFQPIMEGADLL